MRYFSYLSKEEEDRMFHLLPVSFSNTSDREVLAYAVGAALYMPATRESFSEEVLAAKIKGLVSIVIDLEDAVGDHQVELAEESLCRQLFHISSRITMGVFKKQNLPLIFIRVRTPEQLKRVITKLEGNIEIITGFTLPKFSVENGLEYFNILHGYNQSKGEGAPKLYGMPILESSDVIYKESRSKTLLHIKEILDGYKDYVLNVRIGATDFSSLFGLRRSPDMTIYDIGVIRDCITDIINVFGRACDDYIISGPVWEYFKGDRVLKPQLRQTLFEETGGRQGRRRRMEFINVYVDGLIRETAMDKENGIIGKTIIHPSHILPVQSMYIVSHEEYMDATSILENNTGLHGVLKSNYSNKMNEIKPHLSWAKRIIMRAEIYGVLQENTNFTTLMIEGNEHEQIGL
ncbi:HpcH/HpaI aldolase/citrate lyase family protein [Paenibacillus durus]|uniref:Citrate lyase subunit beta n=1 Tax=Paenibacillus durus ATCC 35681 TaxID=1333534 RepID=A0A0F7CGB2_PAEDU|nr:HpcH/HpaI aldolase/citrate lyase family protein [Paenibacillus durus]AKG33356.1 citrate lyase subunit beta [Paenibacillus durus ATCC 35681]